MSLLITFAMSDITARKVKQSLKVVSDKSTQLSKKENEEIKNDTIRLDGDKNNLIVLPDGTEITFYPDSIKFAGYEKEVNANNESFLIVNKSSIAISGIEIKIIYKDMKNRMLHSRTIIETCSVPAGETRKIYIKSWDRQKTYYYYLCNEPRKVATPYKIEIVPLAFFTER